MIKKATLTTRQKSLFMDGGLIVVGIGAAVTGGLLVAQAPVAVYFLVAALALAVILSLFSQHAEWGLLLSIFLIVVQKNRPLPIVGSKLTISELVLLFSAAIWLVQDVRKRNKITIHASALLWPFFIYVLVAGISLLSPHTSNIGKGLSELFARAYLMFFLVVVASYSSTASRYGRVVMAWLGSAALVIGLAALAISGFDLLGLRTNNGQLTTLFRNANALGGYAVGTLLFLLPAALATRPLTAFPYLRMLARLAIPGLAVALYLSHSQGGYIAAAVGLLAWPFVRLHRRLSSFLVSGVLWVTTLAIVALITFPSFESGLRQVLPAIGYQANRVAARSAVIRVQLGSVDDSPIIGVGLGQARFYTASQTSDEEGRGSHTTQVGILAETGMLGLLAVAIILVVFLKIINENSALDMNPNSGWRQIHEGLVIALVGILVFGSVHDVQTSRSMWLILALIVSFKPALLSDPASPSNDRLQALS